MNTTKSESARKSKSSSVSQQGYSTPIDVTCTTVKRFVHPQREHRESWADFAGKRLPKLLRRTVPEPVDDSDEAWKVAKNSLPAFVLAEVQGRLTNETVGAHFSALAIDVDRGLNTRAELDALLRRCERYACAVYESPTSRQRGNGYRVRIIGALSEPLPKEKIKAARHAFARDLGIDPSTSGVSQADSIKQIMFIGRVGGTPERELWTYEGEPWTPPADLEADAPPAAAGERSEAWQEAPDLSMLAEGFERGGVAEGGPGKRDLCLDLGSYLASNGCYLDSIHTRIDEVAPSHYGPERRADVARDVAERFYAGTHTATGWKRLEEHFGEEAMAKLESSLLPPPWVTAYAKRALAKIAAGEARTGWRMAMIEWAGLKVPHGIAGRQASALARTGKSREAIALRREMNEALLAELAPGLNDLETDDSGVPFGTVDNIIRCVVHLAGHALALDVAAGRAVLLERVKLSADAGDVLEPGPWQDVYTVLLQAALNRMRMRHAYGNDVHNAVVAVARKRPLDVHGDWLRSLAEAWDGTARVDGALARYWRAADDGLSAAVSRIMLLGITARGLKPGCQLDTVPVLIGAQGCGKSQSFKALVWGKHRANPEAIGYGAEHRYCGSELDIGRKDGMSILRGHLVWELAELASVKRADVDKVKAYITQQSDTFRPSHARSEVTSKRTVAFVATVNPEKTGHVVVNRDSTGGRRWAPVHVALGYKTTDPTTHHLGVDIAAIERDGAQLLGEAARRVLNGEAWHPTNAEAALLAPAIAAVSEDPVRGDAWYAPLRKWAKARGSEPFAIGEAFRQALDMPDVAKHGQAESRRIASILRDIGCQEKRTKRGWIWSLPG